MQNSQKREKKSMGLTGKFHINNKHNLKLTHNKQHETDWKEGERNLQDLQDTKPVST